MATEMGMPENEDVRKKALLRLGIAGVVTITALAGLWWLDQGSEKKKPEPIVAASPTPILPAPPTEIAPPQTETPNPPGPTQSDTSSSPAISEAGTGAPMEPPPPPRVSNAPTPLPSSPPRQDVPHPATAPAQAQPAVPAAAPMPPAAPSPTQAMPAGKGFVVQLGVFSNPDNAREMLEKLNKQGIRAHMEARVQIGPFLNRREAERAQSEMRKLGYNALVTTSYPVK